LLPEYPASSRERELERREKEKLKRRVTKVYIKATEGLSGQYYCRVIVYLSPLVRAASY
jgi:hypothetical protein